MSISFTCSDIGKTKKGPVIERERERERERDVLFNDALNTFYLRVIWRQTYG